MIAVIDYGAGNIQSVVKALRYIGCEPVLTGDPAVLEQADGAVLPGVGSFGDAMDQLHKRGLVEPIRRFAASGKPLLGICLGLQLLFASSEESPGVEGLNILPGKILRIPDAPGLKIPHMGWNSIDIRDHSGVFDGAAENPYVYFVHSYYLKAEDESIVSATAEYGVTIHAAVHRDNIYATQFHPEKSGETGLAMLRGFVAGVPMAIREG